MAESGLRILMFKAVADGYLLTFASNGPRNHGVAAEKEVAEAIAALNPWQRRWVAGERAWWIADDAITLLAKRVPALSEVLEEWLRRVPDARSYYSTSEFSGAAATSWFPPTVVAAYNKLGLPLGAAVEQVLATRRQLARRHHPDRGGQLASMRAINSATDTVLDWLRRRS